MTNTDQQTCVIVGASHAGIGCAQKLRRQGWEGAIIVLGDEEAMPYHRPPLSKDYLKGEKEAGAILLASAASYEKARIELKLGHHVESIDRKERHVLTSDGTRFDYDKLILATGARVRELPFATQGAPGVCYLRDLNDVDRIRELCSENTRVAIIGGGYIGLEAAATLRSMGADVTVIEAMDRLLQRVTSEPVSAFFTRMHQEEGVTIVCGVQVSGLKGDEGVEAVELANGESIEADVVIVGIGVIPNIELAQSAGLRVASGICVNEFAQTEDPDIYAIGDCAEFEHTLYGTTMRLESVQNANDQGMNVAKSVMGAPEAYTALPWFWSDQYDVKLQIAGLAEGYDDIVLRGDSATERSLSVCYLKNGRLLAVDAMNRPRDFVHGKKLIMNESKLDIDKLKDPDVHLIDAAIA